MEYFKDTTQKPTLRHGFSRCLGWRSASCTTSVAQDCLRGMFAVSSGVRKLTRTWKPLLTIRLNIFGITTMASRSSVMMLSMPEAAAKTYYELRILKLLTASKQREHYIDTGRERRAQA